FYNLTPAKAAPSPISQTTSSTEKGDPLSVSSARWREQIRQILDRNKRYPVDAKSRREHGKVVLVFSLDRDGHVLSSQIEKSSGSRSLDQEAIDLLQRSQPFPSLPSERKEDKVTLRVPVQFRCGNSRNPCHGNTK